MKTTAHVASMVMVLFSAVLVWGGTTYAEEPDHFPLQMGNSWTYSSSRTETIVGTTIRELLEANVNGLRYPTSVELNTWGDIKSTLMR